MINLVSVMFCPCPLFLNAKVSSSTSYQINLSVPFVKFFFLKVHQPIREQFETNWPFRGQTVFYINCISWNQLFNLDPVQV